jgi:hypothetical protein
MDQPKAGDPSAGTSENAARPATPKMPLEAPLIAVPDRQFRPPSPDAGLTQKPSSAPAPRMRPTAPKAAEELRAGPAAAEAPASAADEIASMYAGGQAAYVSPASIGGTSAAQVPGDPMFLRKAMIPILLALGVILAGAGALLIFSGEDNALPDLFPGWMPIALFAVAGLFVILATINVWSLRNVR